MLLRDAESLCSLSILKVEDLLEKIATWDRVTVAVIIRICIVTVTIVIFSLLIILLVVLFSSLWLIL